MKLGGASIPPVPKETRVSACEPQVALKEHACIDASGDEASIMTVCVRQPMVKFFGSRMSGLNLVALSTVSYKQPSLLHRNCDGEEAVDRSTWQEQVSGNCKPPLVSQSIILGATNPACQPYADATEGKGVVDEACRRSGLVGQGGETVDEVI